MTARLPRHGYGRYAHGCRCVVCRKAVAAYMAERRAAAWERARQAGFIADTDSHGTRYAYGQLACRCGPCRAANAAYMAAYRAGKAAGL